MIKGSMWSRIYPNNLARCSHRQWYVSLVFFSLYISFPKTLDSRGHFTDAASLKVISYSLLSKLRVALSDSFHFLTSISLIMICYDWSGISFEDPNSRLGCHWLFLETVPKVPLLHYWYHAVSQDLVIGCCELSITLQLILSLEECQNGCMEQCINYEDNLYGESNDIVTNE